MIYFNLNDPAATEGYYVQYKIINFPDGQRDIEILSIPTTCMAQSPCCILFSITKFADLELISAATGALRNKGMKNIILYSPYILGARSDHPEENRSSYLKQVIAPVLNQLKFNKIYTVDIHSEISWACIDNLHNIPSYEFINNSDQPLPEFQTIIIPDAGAEKRVYKFAQTLTNKDSLKFITCSKTRNILTGKIERINIPDYDTLQGNYVIIDDICDGGGTFLGIVKTLLAEKFIRKFSINLLVTHGIFSNGLTELLQNFSKIYTTNSYPHNLPKDNSQLQIADVFSIPKLTRLLCI